MFNEPFAFAEEASPDSSLLQRLASASLGRKDADVLDPCTGALRLRMQSVKEAKTAQNVQVAKKSERPLLSHANIVCLRYSVFSRRISFNQ